MKKEFTFENIKVGVISLLLSLSCFGFFLRQYKAYTARSFADFLLFSGFFFIILYNQTANIYFLLAAIGNMVVYQKKGMGVLINIKNIFAENQ